MALAVNYITEDDAYEKVESLWSIYLKIAVNDKALRLVGGAPTTVTPPAGVDTYKYILEDEKLADVALVYYTVGLASVAAASNLQIVELPDKLATNAPFSLTVLKGASPDGEKLAQYILSPEGQQVLSKYGFPSPYKSKSVPEGQGVAGTVLAVGLMYGLQKKLKQ